MTRLVLLLLASIVCAAAQQGYAVVAPGGSTVKVSVGGTEYALTAPQSAVPYFTGSVQTTSTSYHYIVDGIAESFERTFPSGRSKTFNDFYGRQETLKPLFQLAQVFPKFSRSVGPNGMYDDDYISTFFITGSDAQSIFSGTDKNPQSENCGLAIISKDDWVYYPKFSFNGKNGEGNPRVEIYGYMPSSYRMRASFKLRPSMFDPIFFREKLYNDVLQSIGVPHQESAFTRVYAGGKPLGFYHLQENAASWDFIYTQFNGNNLGGSVGKYYDCSTGADFGTGGDVNSFLGETDKTPISKLMAATNALDASSDSAIAAFDATWFDTDSFLKAMIIEWLAGHWDSYWFMSSNFVTYQDPTASTSTTYREWFIDQDFDQTFGVAAHYDFDTYSTKPYTQFVGITWPTDDYGSPHRVMLDKLLSNANVKAKFEGYIKAIVTQVFNQYALGARITAIMDRIRPEMTWDLTSARIRPGKQQYSLQDFENNLSQDVNGNIGLMPWISGMAALCVSKYGAAPQNPPVSGTMPLTNTASSSSGLGSGANAPVPPSATTAGAAPSATTGTVASNSTGSVATTGTVSNGTGSVVTGSDSGSNTASASASGSNTAAASGSATDSATGSATDSATDSASGTVSSSGDDSSASDSTTGVVISGTQNNENSDSASSKQVVALALTVFAVFAL